MRDVVERPSSGFVQPLRPGLSAGLWDSALIFVVAAGTAFVTFRDQLLPARFSYDSAVIQGLAQGIWHARTGGSFSSIGQVYRSLGLADHPLVASVIGFCVSIVVLVAARIAVGRNMTHAAWSTLSLFVLLSAVFLADYSKDVLVLFLVLAALLLGDHWRYEALMVTCILGYAWMFRHYWVVIAVGYVLLRLLYSRRPTPLLVTVVHVLGVAAASVGIWVVQGNDADHYREVVNQQRLGDADAQTMIGPYVDLAEPLGGLVNNVLTLCALTVPLPLALSGKSVYLLVAPVLCAVWITFFVGVWRGVCAGSDGDHLVKRSSALVGAFLVTQALFEPDYGSALRHLTPLLPLIAVVRARARAGRREPRPRTQTSADRRPDSNIPPNPDLLELR